MTTMSLLQTIPSPMKIREELERMVLKDLLGPVGGPEEEIAEQSVRDRYLVGILAPSRQERSPEEFDELPQGGSGPVEDGTPESSSPANKTMFPSSFGITFCVRLDAKALQINARWGHYHRDRSATLTTPSGDKKLVWKRSQREAVSEPIALAVGRLNWTLDAEFPQVQVQGLVRKREHFWSVTPFLRGAPNHAPDRCRLAQAGRAGRGYEGAGRDAHGPTGGEAAAPACRLWSVDRRPAG